MTDSVANNLNYHGGRSAPAYSGGGGVPFDTSATISHLTAFDIRVTQNGQDVSTFETGPAEVTVNLKTTSRITDTLSASSTDSPNNVAQTNPKALPLMYNDEYFNYMNSRYDVCLIRSPTLEGLHAINDPDIIIPNTYGSDYCFKTLSNPTTININYKPYNDAPTAGMGKGYLYCQGNLLINGVDAGKITSTDQDFAANITINIGTMTSIPVQAVYECFFVSELYDKSGNKQVLMNIIHQMPNGAPITPIVIVPIIRPPDINLIPLIRIGTTDYTTDTTITLTQTQLTNLSFLVQRTDTLINILTTNLTWTYLGTPPEMPPALTTNPNWPLIPPLTGNNPPNPPQLLQPPTVVTICDVGKTRDTITLSINPDGTISETNTGDNTITLTIICQPEININLIPVITINTSTGTTTYLTDTTITLRRNERINLSLLVQRTDILNIPTTNLTWNYRMPPVNLLITDNTPFNPPLTGRTPINPPRLLQPPSEITVCEGDVISDTIVLTVNSDGSVSEIDVGDNTIIITINCQEDEMFFCRFRPHTQIIAPMEMGSTMMTCWNGTAEQIDCPTIDSDWIDYSDGFATYFETPIDWDQITYDSHDADNFNITAKERPLSEIAYSGEVTIDINPENDWEIWRNCDFDVRWGRQNCSYYM
jgi:hypothetical protein